MIEFSSTKHGLVCEADADTLTVRHGGHVLCLPHEIWVILGQIADGNVVRCPECEGTGMVTENEGYHDVHGWRWGPAAVRLPCTNCNDGIIVDRIADRCIEELSNGADQA